MFQSMRRQNKIVASGGDADKFRGLEEKLSAGRAPPVEDKGAPFPEILIPQPAGAEIAVVEIPDQRIDRQQSAAGEDAAWPADFKPCPVCHQNRQFGKNAAPER